MASTTGASEGPVSMIIREKLTQAFHPSHLEVICESHMHNVPKGSEKHFKVSVVSDKFEGLPLIKRHRLVNEALAEELAGPVHALRIDAYPTSQYTGQKSAPSPACRGGGAL
uniref:BolA-like protein 1 n=1 Tax=Plectus sambesii TaxID=2011161 RepID=A0A914V0H0_9BILA